MIIKNIKINQKYIIAIALSFFIGQLNAQDQNLAGINSLSMWYNPSQKSDKDLTVRMNYRDLRYQGLLGYRSSVGMVDIPLKTGKTNELDDKGFWNLSLGFSLDESNQNILKSTQALLGLSYALPLNGNNTYLSMSLQGSYFNSRMDFSNTSFPDQFDRNGPIANAITNDPLRTGDARGWNSSHLGMSVFKRTDLESWSLGIALRDVNQPLINRQSGIDVKLKPTFSLQGNYSFTKDQMIYDLRGFVGLKSEASQQLISLSAKYKFNDNDLSSFGSGLAYRFRDAIIPYIDFTLKQSTVSLYYEMNVSGINASGYNRSAFELSVSHRFAKKDKN